VSIEIVGGLAILVMLVLGVPIWLALTGAGIVLLLIEGSSVPGIAQDLLDHMNSATLLAIPFFVVAAGFIQGGGIARAMMNMSAVWVGRLPGGLPIAALIATAIFAAINGSSVATVLAMGTIVLPELTSRGYSRRFAMGLTASAGTLGILIPPSTPMIVYGLVSETSIPRLFLAGVVPALLQMALFCVVILIFAKREGGTTAPFAGWKNFGRVNANAVPALAVPAVIMFGIYGGFVTVTEAAALSAAVALIVSLVAYNSLRIVQIPSILVEGMMRTAAIMLIVAGADLLADWLTREGIAHDLAKFMGAQDLGPMGFMFLMAAVLLLLGTVLEGYAIILLTMPLTLPILHGLEIDLVHYAVFMVIGIELAMLSPPVGMNLFVMAGIAGAPVSEVERGMWPFFFAMLVMWVLVIIYPQISTALPDYFLGPAR
jgi:C4-dicarboxylate transporter DctM subunit